MTGKEVFELYAGQIVPIPSKPKIFHEGSARLIGYSTQYEDIILVERKDGHSLNEYKSHFIMIDDLLADTLAWSVFVYDCYWSNLTPNQKFQHLCCRCGQRYNSKKQHRGTCR